ncbi:hypothetical protein Avbf_11221, partial [Armadillidium vulgare]
MMTSATPPLVTTPEGKKVLGMSVEGMVLQTLYTMENKKTGPSKVSSSTVLAPSTTSPPIISSIGSIGGEPPQLQSKGVSITPLAH